MLAVLVAMARTEPILVTVPSQVLRDQTGRKFARLGILRELGVLSEGARNPIVGVLRHRPQSSGDLDFLKNCHVVIGTIGALAQGSAVGFSPEFAANIDTLLVDEAHHVPAASWTTFRAAFRGKKILQFTATPFRRDGELVDGDVIYNYPLKAAQNDGFFKPIEFLPVFEIDSDLGDQKIVEVAVERLRQNLADGLDHLIMARCASIPRAIDVARIYAAIAPDLNPVLVHSEIPDSPSVLAAVRARQHRVVICVDMLGEGFDLPNLKIAAMHDPHKSLAILLQFTGRFTRSSGGKIGDASVVANIANQNVSAALERLYSEDADWNLLLSEFSSEAVSQHAALVDFLKNSEPLGAEDAVELLEISPHLLRPKFSTVAFDAKAFHPKRFFHGLSASVAVQRVWLHRESSTLYFVTRCEPTLQWTRSKDLKDRQWDLFVLHFDPIANLLFVHSSDKSSTHDGIARAVSGENAQLLFGDVVFRTLGNINRLQFQQVGLKKHGRRNLRYALYTGADVAEALGLAERSGSEKSNLFGGGWEGGAPVSMGCSYKGRVWSKQQGSIPELIEWLKHVGAKLRDSSIDTSEIIKHVLIPEEVAEIPNEIVLSIDWPVEMLHQTEERVVFSGGESSTEAPISMVSLDCAVRRATPTQLEFSVSAEGMAENLILEVGGERGFEVRHSTGSVLNLKIGRISGTLADYLSDYPPLVKFVDMSELDGNLLVRMRDVARPAISLERLDVWDWSGVDITTESLWKGGRERQDSIQGHVAARYVAGGYSVVFDDDAKGEAADLVCLREEAECIRVALVHCKFAGGDTPGSRIEDVVEVCSQAMRSSKWKWRFRELGRHLLSRERRLRTSRRHSRFIAGNSQELNRFVALSRFRPVKAEVVIVQPGLSKSALSEEQGVVLAAADTFLKETIDTNLDIICSS